MKLVTSSIRAGHLRALKRLASNPFIDKPIRILLINAVKEGHYAVGAPLGISSLGHNLQKRFGNRVSLDLIDTGRVSLGEASKLIRENQYDIIGISANVGALEEVEKLIAHAQNNPEQTIILGNILATFEYEHFLEKYPDILIVRGEGEEALIGLVNMAFSGADELKSIPNLAFAHDGEIFFTARRRADLGQLSPPRSGLFPPKQIVSPLAQAFLETGRGCKYDVCTFCNRGAFYGGKRRDARGFAIPDVTETIAFYSARGVRRLNLVDEDFFADTGRLKSFIAAVRKLKRQGSIADDFKFSAAIKPSDAREENRQLLIELAEIGFRWFFLGAESGSDAQLKRYMKGISAEELRQGLDLIQEIGLAIESGFIMIDPYMTPGELRENIQFLEATQLYRYAHPVHVYRAQRGSRLLRQLEKGGLLIPNTENRNWQTQDYRFKDETIALVAAATKEVENKTVTFGGRLGMAYREYLDSPDNPYAEDLHWFRHFLLETLVLFLDHFELQQVTPEKVGAHFAKLDTFLSSLYQKLTRQQLADYKELLFHVTTFRAADGATQIKDWATRVITEQGKFKEQVLSQGGKIGRI
ncbi:B12-binding domain-containing radical SAM protein [Candidatus Margulisiibacteriota bacterium]